MLESVLEVLVLLLSEKDYGGVMVTEDGLDVVLAKSDQLRNGSFFSEGDDFILVGSASVSDGRVIESAGEGDSRGLSTVFRSAARVCGLEELVLLRYRWVAGTLNKSIVKVTIGGSEVGNGQFGICGGSLHCIAVNLSRDRAGFLVDPFDDGVLGATTSVVQLGSLARSKNRG